MDRDAPYERPKCPFCPFTVPSQDKLHMLELFQHVEFNHSENDGSPFRVRDSASARASPVSARFPPSPHGHSPHGHSPHPPSPLSQSPHAQRPALASPRHSWASWEGAVSSRGGTPSPTYDPGDYYVECPLEDCGEAVHVREMDHHMDFHDSENMAMNDESFDAGSHEASPHRRSSPSAALETPPDEGLDQRRHRSANRLAVPPMKAVSASPARRWSSTRPKRSSRGIFLGPASRKTRSSSLTLNTSSIKRLGIEELGPYAFEDKMPKSLCKQLENGAPVIMRNQLDAEGNVIRVESITNEVRGIIPVIARLCRSDSNVSKVFLCDARVEHVFKMPKEGGFCGYRNIQMVISFLQQNNFPGAEKFSSRLPSILDLQDLIETAWDRGFDSHSRIQTGGIKGTRKYIGTPEAQALFSSLGIGCEANQFSKPVDKARDHIYVHDKVYEAVFKYFCTGVSNPHEKVYQTGLAPIYFQHPGHSLTIIGLEVRKSGGMNLLVFDPMFKTPPPILDLIGSTETPTWVRGFLKPFRRGDSYLKGYNSFEVLKLTGPQPPTEAFRRLRVKETPSRSPSRRPDPHRYSNHDIAL